MFSKDKIDGWINLALVGVNKSDDKSYPENNGLRSNIIEAKVQTDRWGNVATDIIVHSSHKDFVRKELKFNELNLSEDTREMKSVLDKIKSFLLSSEPEAEPEDVDFLWGATIHYSDNIPEDVGLMLVLENENLKDVRGYDDEPAMDRCVALFPM